MRYLILVLALTGCATSNYGEKSLDEYLAVNPPTGNQAKYDLGKKDGCNSGRAATGNYFYKANKDIEMYVNDKYYKSGYDDGFQECKTYDEQLNNMMN